LPDDFAAHVAFFREELALLRRMRVVALGKDADNLLRTHVPEIAPILTKMWHFGYAVRYRRISNWEANARAALFGPASPPPHHAASLRSTLRASRKSLPRATAPRPATQPAVMRRLFAGHRRNTMTIRSDALRWLAERFGVRDGHVYTSKFYTARESWTREAAWWIEFPRDILDKAGSPYLHLVCQIAPDNPEFHYLRVPKDFLKANLSRLHVHKNDRVSLFLSAEAANVFLERRGNSRVSFMHFLMP
jgi:hypothetical protein